MQHMQGSRDGAEPPRYRLTRRRGGQRPECFTVKALASSNKMMMNQLRNMAGVMEATLALHRLPRTGTTPEGALEMGIVEGQLKAAKRALLNDAGERWLKRKGERESGLKRVKELGPGAADSPKQQMQFALRQASKAMLGMPRFAERIIGTRDFQSFAPSPEGAAAAATVARITNMPENGYETVGFATGLLLPGGLLLTNYHVFPTETYAMGCAANFGYVKDERGSRAGSYFELTPGEFFHSNATFDFALVAVEPKGWKGEDLTSLGSTPLIESTGKTLVGLGLNIVQHPGGGVRQYAFNNNRLLDILAEGYLHYETDTEPGSSGAMVTNTDWELVALHHCSVPNMRDGQILLKNGRGFWDQNRDSDDDIDWVANEGIRVSRIVEELKKVQLPDAKKQARLSSLISAARDPFESTLGGAVPPNKTIAIQGVQGMSANNVFNVTGPVTMHVYAPGESVASPSPVTAGTSYAGAGVKGGGALAVEKVLVFDTAYSARKGYNPKFLGVQIDLPTVDAGREAELYSVGDYKAYFDTYRDIPEVDVAGLDDASALEIKYHHYSLVQNKRFLMCMWAASNCDYRDIQRQDARNRGELGGENWRADPRVPLDIQLINSDIYQPGKRIDRGHIVRREDNCWGPVGLPTDYANADTYHYTNCTPQHEAFNQGSPKDKEGETLYKDAGQHGIWGQFEGELQKAIETGGGQAVIFAGPVLVEKECFPPVTVAGRTLLLPRKFWKVVVVADGPKKNPELKSYGYIFDQSGVVRKYGFGLEGVELPAFERNRKTLEYIQELTGVRLAQVVLEAEQPIR